MAILHQCDRCGYQHKEDNRFLMVRIEAEAILDRDARFIDWELCKTCATQIEKFLRNKNQDTL